jgi:hypothetical protein
MNYLKYFENIDWEDWDEEELEYLNDESLSVINHLRKTQYNDSYSYNNNRIVLIYNNKVYSGGKDWMNSNIKNKLNQSDIDAILAEEAYITSGYTSTFTKFKYWTLSELIKELKDYNQSFIF